MSTLPRRNVGRVLWTLSPAATLGIGAPFVAIHVALKVRSAVTAAFAVAVTSLAGIGGVLSANNPGGSDLAGFFFIGAAVVGTAVAAAYGSAIFGPAEAASGALPAVSDDESVRLAKAREQRRIESAKLAKSDPELARDLRIGRPDERGTFDDGGLVDINHVPAAVLTTTLGLSQQSADHVIAVRTSLGRFDGPDDLVAFAGVPLELIDANRDRLIAL